MLIHKNIEIQDLSLHLKKYNTLIISDIHIGYEEALNKQGLLIPRLQFKETLQKLSFLKKYNKIIINGDLKHEFGNISETEWRQTLKLIDLFSKHSKEIILIKGNHDTIIGPIARKVGLSTKDYFKIENIYITHGDEIPKNNDFKNSKIIIIGHEHPAISISSKQRREIYKCFLKGRYRNKMLIVMPSFNLVTEGTDILKESLLSPFLQQNLDNFEVFIVEDKIYNFGKLKNIK